MFESMLCYRFSLWQQRAYTGESSTTCRRLMIAGFAAAIILASNPCFAQKTAVSADTPPTETAPAKKPPVKVQALRDGRLGRWRNTDDEVWFEAPHDGSDWESRSESIRLQVAVSTGLWPMPTRGPVKATIHGSIARDGYTIDKVFFASRVGHYVSGNLYRPTTPPRGGAQRYPGVLFAHGHWKKGRFELADDKQIAEAIQLGGEPNEKIAKYFMQAIPATLAKRGFVVFQFDMVGYADSQTINHNTAMTDVESALRLQSVMGLQTWNALRAFDFLAGLEIVDPERIGMTGASGGGTQTFILGALEPRLAAAFPAVMVSTQMQGGCICENSHYLRIGISNVDIAAVFAPRPLAMSCCNDWTRHFLQKGLPGLKQVYGQYQAEDKVTATLWPEFPHNYYQPSREMMYAWFEKHLLGEHARSDTENLTEPDFEPVEPMDLSVYTAEFPRPSDDLPETALRQQMTQENDAWLSTLQPTDEPGLRTLQETILSAIGIVAGTFSIDLVVHEQSAPKPMSGKKAEINLQRWVIGSRKGTEAIPIAILTKNSYRPLGQPIEGNNSTPNNADPPFKPQGTLIWIDPRGISSLTEVEQLPKPVAAALEAGLHVMTCDLLGTGSQFPIEPRPVNSGSARYTFCYNRPLFVEQVRDVLTVASLASLDSNGNRKDFGSANVRIIGNGSAGPVVAIAAAAAPSLLIERVAVDLDQFLFSDVTSFDSPRMFPGALKYGDMPMMLATVARLRLFAHNAIAAEQELRPESAKRRAAFQIIERAYNVAGTPERLTFRETAATEDEITQWLMAK